MLCARDPSGLTVRTSAKRVRQPLAEPFDVGALEELADEGAARRQQPLGARQRPLEQRLRARLVGRAHAGRVGRHVRQHHVEARPASPSSSASGVGEDVADAGRARPGSAAVSGSRSMPTTAPRGPDHVEPRTAATSPAGSRGRARGRPARSRRSGGRSPRACRRSAPRSPAPRAFLKKASWRCCGSPSLDSGRLLLGGLGGGRGAALLGGLHRVLRLDLFDRRAGRVLLDVLRRCP